MKKKKAAAKKKAAPARTKTAAAKESKAMIDQIARLTEAIRKGRMLSRKSIRSYDADKVLDGRDRPAFDSRWGAAYEKAAAGKISAAQEAALTELRKQAFLAVYNACKHDELSAYVSDDFDLIGRAYFKNAGSPIVADLLACYLGGDIPTSQLARSRATLSELFDGIA